MLIQFSEDELFNRPFSDLHKKQILALMDRPPSDIDTSDIPEITELPPGTVRGRFYRGPTVRLNEELRRYFADRSSREGVPFNDLVIETLAKAVSSSEAQR